MGAGTGEIIHGGCIGPDGECNLVYQGFLPDPEFEQDRRVGADNSGDVRNTPQKCRAILGFTLARVSAAMGPVLVMSFGMNGCTPAQSPRAEVGDM